MNGRRQSIPVKAAWIAACLLGNSLAQADMAEHAHRTRVAGIDVITYPTQVSQVVVIIGALPAGDAMAGPDNVAIPTLTGMMLDRGTRTLDKFAIAAELDDVGAQLSFGVGTQSLEIRAKCLKKDLPRVMKLLAAELRTPAFPPAEFAKARQEFIGSLQESLQNTEARAQEAFTQAVFPPGHPNRTHSTAEFLAAAKTATVEQVKAFHASEYGPLHFTLVVVGDVSAPEVEAQVAQQFTGWSGGRDYIRPTLPPAAATARTITVPLEGKTSVSMLLGQATGLTYRDPGALALRVGTAILGHGFTGRLMGTVRDREGLTYSIGAGLAEDSITDGEWHISASFAPSLLDKGIASTRRVLDTWWKEGITESELESRKQGIVGGYLVGLSTTGGLAGTILSAVQRGYGLEWLDGYPQAVKALTREEVNQSIRAHLDPERMVLIEAGSVPGSAAAPAR